ncbi:MAG: RtcB family protein [bacterium]|nr:RtcB family protein [bacterium]
MATKSQLALRDVGDVEYFRNVEVDADSPEIEFEQATVRAVATSMDQLMRTPTLVAGAVMPDACPTGDATIPVGGVVIAENAIHPGFHSADICCSVMATNFGQGHDPQTVLDIAQKVSHFGRGGRKRSAGVFKRLHSDLAERIRSNQMFGDRDFKKAQLHLGTQGDGNHFLFVGRSESHGGVTLVTHHGSRAFGAGLFEKGMKIAESHRQAISPETLAENAWIPADSEEGVRYWDALQVVRDWTKLNHQVIHRLIAEQLGSAATQAAETPEASFWNEHNFVFRKPQVDRGRGDWFFHAKGATPLEDWCLPDSNNGLRLIPLNMGEPILVVRGQASETNLGIAPHGAGRNMSRTMHKQIRRAAGKTDDEIFAEETQGIDARFFSGRVDVSELPSAYKNADQVQRQMAKFGLGNIVDRIQPYGCLMAGSR